MKNLFLILALLHFAHLFGQQRADQEFESRRNQVEQLAYSDADAAFAKANSILKEAKQSRSAAKIAKAESTMALVKIYLTELDDAKKRNEKSLQYHLKNNDVAELANNYFNAALLSERQSDYVHSIQFFHKAIANAEKSKDYVLIQKSCRGLAMSYLDQHNFDKAMEYANKSLAYQKFHKDEIQRAFALAAIGEVYRLKGDLPRANRYFKSAFVSFGAIGNEYGQAWVQTNWALCYADDLIRLTETSMEAQKIWDRTAPENTMSIMNLGNIGYNLWYISHYDTIYKPSKSLLIPKTRKGLLDLGKIYLERSVAIAQKKKNRNALVHHGTNLAAVYYSSDEYQVAYQQLHKSWLLADSLYSQENKNKIADLESEKDILIRDEKIKRDKITLANKEKQKWYLIGGLALLAVIGVLLFNQSRNRQKTNEQLRSLNNDLDQKNAALDQANKTNARFFSILNHDLRSPVYNLIHYLHLQKDSPELLDAEMKQNIEAKNIASAENLLQSMEDLLAWSKSQMENFSPQFKEVAVADLFSDTQKHFSSFEKVTLAFENPQDLHLNTDDNYLKTILRNLTGNAIKALRETENPTIIWKAWQQNGQTFLSISDNGPGINDEQLRALYDDTEVVGIQSGLGLHVIRDLAKVIHCTISVESKPGAGTTFALTFG
ncbi:ATP-binding protein [Flavobacterium sp.]|uniref:tetratricopeptide repeat-containing sensor histidine kinase n=1 Tax=Flavobacterium sp. TaxID=239 RepID=UPI0039E4CE4B